MGERKRVSSKGGDETAERNSVHEEEQRTNNRVLGNGAEGGIKGRTVIFALTLEAGGFLEQWRNDRFFENWVDFTQNMRDLQCFCCRMLI